MRAPPRITNPPMVSRTGPDTLLSAIPVSLSEDRSMKTRSMLGAALAVALLACAVGAEEQIKSGPQAGQSLAPFNPVHATGPDEGLRLDLLEKYGQNPVALIFAR